MSSYIVFLSNAPVTSILCDVSDSFAVVALQVTAIVPHHLHGDAAACDRLRVERARRLSTYIVCTMCRMSSSPKVLPLVAGGSCPLVLARNGLEDDILVPLVVCRLSHFFEEVTAFVQDGK